jgi:hypothetical protein
MMLQLYNFYFICERKKNKEKEQNINDVVILISVVKVSTSAPPSEIRTIFNDRPLVLAFI